MACTDGEALVDPPCMVDVSALFDGMATLSGDRVVSCSPKATRYTKVGANLVQSVVPEARQILSDAVSKQTRLKLRTTLSGRLVDLTVFGTLVLFSEASELRVAPGGGDALKEEDAAGGGGAVDRGKNKNEPLAAATSVAAVTEKAAALSAEGAPSASTTATSASAFPLSALQTTFSYENDATGRVTAATSALKELSFVNDGDELFKVHDVDIPRFLAFESTKLKLLGSTKEQQRRTLTITLRISQSSGGWQWSRLIAMCKPPERETILTTVTWTVSFALSYTLSVQL